MEVAEFQALVWAKGRDLYRDMPWRTNTDPYYVLVSELMLQQTQVDRVIPKFNAFIERFPDVYALAVASLADVLTLWNGLGYNRRAKFLHDSAQMIVDMFGGQIPAVESELRTLPGIGPNTAAAILAYGFNQPTGFIETNIRTVYFRHYFEDSHTVTDVQLREVVAATVDSEHPREWYWALMDYGSYLKRQGAGQIDKSAHYKKQSPLLGSVREVRGQIIRALTKSDMSEPELVEEVVGDSRFGPALQGVIDDGLVVRSGDKLHLTK
jgi:A/G-specific adenine glycosylase